MSTLNRVLCVILIAEVVCAAGWLSWVTDQAGEPMTSGANGALNSSEATRNRAKKLAEPPLPDLNGFNAVLEADLRRLRTELAQKARRGDDNPEDWHLLAQAYYAFGRATDAELCYRRAATLDPPSFEIYFRWGNCLSRLGHIAEAIDQYHRAIPLGDRQQRRRAWYRIGLGYLRDENARDAEAAFKEARHFGPGLMQLAKLYLRTGRVGEAQRYLDEMSSPDSQTVDYFLMRARVEEALKRPRAAIQYRLKSERASETMPRVPVGMESNTAFQRYGLEPLIRQNVGMLRSRKFTELADSCRKVLAIEWDPQTAWLLAQSEYFQDRPDQVIAILEELFRRVPIRPRNLALLGEACVKKGEINRAYETWQRALRIGPDVTVTRRLEDYHRRRSEQEKAEFYMAMLHYTTGVQQLRANHLADAKTHLKKAVELAPNDPQAWFYLAECHRYFNEADQAEQAYDRCLSLNPDHGRALRRRTLIDAKR